VDLSEYTDEDLLLAATRAEVDARELYTGLASGVHNMMLRDRLAFLADEEAKHMAFLEQEYERRFPGKALDLPERSPVPLPAVRVTGEDVMISEVLGMAMEAERAARGFYISMAERFASVPATRAMLLYFASMEMGHYHILSAERENVLRNEDYDVDWGMMHVGP